MRRVRSPYVENLRKECRDARKEVADQFTQRPVHPPEAPELRAWGQYLRAVNPRYNADLGSQYGIFGTSAGLEVLARQSPDEYGAVLAAACPVLPPVAAPDNQSKPESGARPDRPEPAPPPNGQLAVHRYFTDKGDLRVVYKLCALLDAAVAICMIENLRAVTPCTQEAAAEALFSVRVHGSGWPDHGGSDSDYRRPSVHATAVALLSLSRFAGLTQPQLDACQEAVSYLAEAPLDNQSVATLALIHLGVLGLRERLTGGESRKHTAEVLGTCRRNLLRWTKITAPDEVRRSLEGTEYRLPDSSDKPEHGSRFDFLIYLPHCVVALACLSSPELLRKGHARRFAVGVVKVVAQDTKEHGYLVAAGRSLVSAVEHLWLHRLLTKFATLDQVHRGWRAVVADRVARTRQGPLRVAGLILAGVAMIVGIDLADGFFKTLLAGIFTLGIAVIASLLAWLVVDNL